MQQPINGKPEVDLPRGRVQGASRSLLRDTAYMTLKQRIVSGEYPPGVCLSERELAKELEMSNTPVKSALQRLESEGFVNVSPQRGIIVRELSVREVLDLFEMRLCLESFTYMRLGGKLRPEQKEQLRANLDEQESCAKKSNASRCMQLDAEFHGMFCRFLGNAELQREMRRVSDQMFREVLMATRRHAERLQESYQEHCNIADAVIEGNVNKAVQLLEEHLEWGKQTLMSPHSSR